MNKLTIFHTTPTTIGMINGLSEKYIGHVSVNNILDDSILPELMESQDNMINVYERMLKMVRCVKHSDCLLLACSSVGGFTSYAKNQIDIPIMRIDEPMIDKAIALGNKIAVIASLETTLNPTIAFLIEKSKIFSEKNEFICKSFLLDNAFTELKKGNVKEHNDIILECIIKILPEYDSIVLAQASMAQSIANLSDVHKVKILTSPDLAFKKLKALFS